MAGGRYGFLDGMRGLGALIVLEYHVAARFTGSTVFPNAPLALDFFFVLSGFILGYAYERRLADASWADFMAVRIRRLYPLSILGGAIGAAYLAARLAVSPERSDRAADTLATIILNLVALPKLWTSTLPGSEMFPANPALWSLFGEMLGSMLWFALLMRASAKELVLAAFVAGLWLGWGTISYSSLDVGSTPGGFFTMGLTRVIFGISVGTLIWRWHHLLPRLGPLAGWGAAALLLASIMAPTHEPAFLLVGLFVVTPLIVVLGVCAADRTVGPVSTFMSWLSFPLYATHMPVLMWLSGTQKLLNLNPALVALAAPVPCLIVAYIAARWLEPPISSPERLGRECTQAGYPTRMWWSRHLLGWGSRH